MCVCAHGRLHVRVCVYEFVHMRVRDVSVCACDSVRMSLGVGVCECELVSVCIYENVHECVHMCL